MLAGLRHNVPNTPIHAQRSSLICSSPLRRASRHRHEGLHVPPQAILLSSHAVPAFLRLRHGHDEEQLTQQDGPRGRSGPDGRPGQCVITVNDETT
jgi:hypothetical protein